MSKKKQFDAATGKSGTLEAELKQLEKATHELATRLRSYYDKGGRNSDALSLAGSAVGGIVLREGDDKRGWQGNKLSDIDPATGVPYGRA